MPSQGASQPAQIQTTAPNRTTPSGVLKIRLATVEKLQVDLQDKRKKFQKALAEVSRLELELAPAQALRKYQTAKAEFQSIQAQYRKAEAKAQATQAPDKKGKKSGASTEVTLRLYGRKNGASSNLTQAKRDAEQAKSEVAKVAKLLMQARAKVELALSRLVPFEKEATRTEILVKVRRLSIEMEEAKEVARKAYEAVEDAEAKVAEAKLYANFEAERAKFKNPPVHFTQTGNTVGTMYNAEQLYIYNEGNQIRVAYHILRAAEDDLKMVWAKQIEAITSELSRAELYNVITSPVARQVKKELEQAQQEVNQATPDLQSLLSHLRRAIALLIGVVELIGMVIDLSLMASAISLLRLAARMTQD